VPTDVGITELRDQVLRKIGRNVVNLQKMEAMLKVLNSVQFLRSACSNADEQVGQRNDREISVSFSWRIEADPILTRERKRALRAAVAERNKWIHEWLAGFDPNSMESCANLRAQLDEQHAKIWPEFERLKSIVQTSRELIDGLRRHLTSDEFVGEIQSAAPGR
jgi:hypothetical protein